MTIDPKTLTSEERAIWDAEVSHVGKAFPFTSWRERYDAAWLSVAPQVLARRALFSPAQPEPKREECPDCFEAIPCGCDEVDWEPAPSAAPVAGELAEAVERAISRLLKPGSPLEQNLAATYLETWARSQATAQPVAVGMTPELARQFDRLGAQLAAAKLVVQNSSSSTASVCAEIGKAQETSDAILSALRAQAVSAQPKAVGVPPNVRELVSLLLWKIRNNQGSIAIEHYGGLLIEAQKEIDCWPERVEKGE